MTNDKLPDRIADILGVAEMSAQEQEQFWEEVGDIIAEACITRLLLTLTEEDMLHIKLSIEDNFRKVGIFEFLLDTYPHFEKIVREEVFALQTETLSVIGD